jgi:hypothetical protein
MGCNCGKKKREATERQKAQREARAALREKRKQEATKK